MAQFVVRSLEEAVKARRCGAAPYAMAGAWKKKCGTSCATQ